jgi:CheY-like chemotaxis protein
MSLKEHLVVEAAHGVIAELLAVDIGTASRVLDGYVSRSGRSLREVAFAVTEGSLRLTWGEHEALSSGGSPPSANVEVLYIGDRQRNAPFLEQIVDRWPDAQVTAAPPEREGLEAIRQHPPDLVLLDGGLPDLDARDVLRQIRGDPSNAGLPVVVLGADDTLERAGPFLDAGADRYLTAPLDLASLDQLLIDLTPGSRSASRSEGP